MSTLSNVLGIFAKEPIAGQVKTRLAATTSAAWAQRVAQACLEDSLDRLSIIQAYRVIAYAPPTATAFFDQLAAERFELMAQAEGDLGQRLQSFFDDFRRRGFGRIVVVGSDSPTLPIEYVRCAFTALETHDLVIGPAADGGYYLIGGSTGLTVFDGIPWSSADVLKATLERARAQSARVELLPTWYDIDTADDWQQLCAEVQANRSAGVDPSVPSLERLMADFV